MTRRRKVLLAIAGAFSLLIAATVLYLALSDLSGWRDTVARLASEGMARELTIAGEFEVDLGIVTRVHATELALANTEWASEPRMATIERLDGEINLWELFSGSIHLPTVEIEGGRAIFESDAQEASNWMLGSGDNTEAAGPIRLRIDAIRARDVDLVFRTPSAGRDWDIAISALDSTGDDVGMQLLTGSGRVRGTEFAIHGSLGSLESLVNLESVDHDLRLTLGEAFVTSSGSIADLGTLTGLDVQAVFAVPSPEEITDLLDLPTAPLRELTGSVRATTDANLTDLRFDVSGPGADLVVEGTIDSVIAPGDADLAIDYSGPDIRPLAALIGINELPEQPFHVTGGLRWQGFPIEVSDLAIEVGENRLTANGRLGRPPLMLGTDFQIRGAGPNIASLAVFSGHRMPQVAFDLDGRLLRVEGGLQIENVSAELGSTRLEANGFIGDAPSYSGTELELDVAGSDLSRFSSLLGLELPAARFRAAGRLAQGNNAIALDNVKASLGDARVDLGGRLTTEPGLVGTDLHFTAHGLDLLDLGDMLGFDGLPSSPLRAEGRVKITADGYRPQNVRVRIADLDCTASGLITRNRHLVGTSLSIAAEGGDASILTNLVPNVSLPQEEFRISGGFEILTEAYRIRELSFELGETSGTIDGRVSTLRGLVGTVLEIEAGGPSLAVFDPLLPHIALPPAEFTASGKLEAKDTGIALQQVTFSIGDTRLQIDGTLRLDPGLVGSDLVLGLAGSNLDAFGELVRGAAVPTLPDLPARPFSVACGVTIDEIGYHSPDLELTLGKARSSISGVIGHPPEFTGSDIVIQAEGPDASLIVTAMEADAAAEPFHLAGRISKDTSGLTFDDFKARIGGYSAEIDGSLGKLPRLIGTSLSVQAAGPDLELLRQILENESLPSQPFKAAGHFEGTPRRFRTNALDISFGSSDVSGDLRVDLEDKPRFTARLHSNHLMLDELFSAPDDEDLERDPTSRKKTKEPPERLISDQPWDLGFLDVIDLDLDWDIDRLDYLLAEDRDVELSLILKDGGLKVDRFHGTGSLAGVVDGTLSLEPVVAGHRLVGELSVDNGMLNLAGDGADPSQYTPGDLHINIDATGRSLHEMLASADGRAVLTVDGGVLEKGIIDLISADILVTLLEALNPFAKQDDTTNLNCAVLVATFDQGTMTLDPAAIQTDKVTVLGDGTIDFETEKLRLNWITKPRKGIGISASMFTNPSIRLGGKLADPHLEMKPAQAVASTGIAVATMGISLVAKGMADRITAEKKVCEKAMKQVAKMEAGASKK